MYAGSLDAFSNRADWKARYRVIDSETGEDVDLTGCTVVLGVYDENKCQRLTGTTGDGIITLEEYTTGVFSIISWSFDDSAIRNICSGTYNVGVTISNDDQTMQFIIGSVACLDGNVP